MDYKELCDEKLRIKTELKKLMDKPKEENRQITEAEDEEIRKFMRAYDANEANLILAEEDVVKEVPRIITVGKTPEDEAIAQAYRSFLRDPKRMKAEEYTILGQDTERRALQADLKAAGGYMAPEEFVAELIKDVGNQTFIWNLARKFPITMGASLGAPVQTADPSDAEWTGEITTRETDSSMAFGNRELKPSVLSKEVKVSKKLLMVSAIPVDALVREAISYVVGITLEKAFMTGTGNNQPLGVFTASDSGISTGRDVSTGNTTTSITFDGLIECKYALKAGYLPRAQWIFHRDGLKAIRKIKNTDGDYVWAPSVVTNEPDRILNLPVNMSEYAPNTFTTGKYVGVLGDFYFYWVAYLNQLIIQVLDQLYARTGQNGYLSTGYYDGMPVLENAFARVKLA